jgi:hypothetical protein
MDLMGLIFCRFLSENAPDRFPDREVGSGEYSLLVWMPLASQIFDLSHQILKFIDAAIDVVNGGRFCPALRLFAGLWSGHGCGRVSETSLAERTEPSKKSTDSSMRGVHLNHSTSSPGSRTAGGLLKTVDHGG